MLRLFYFHIIKTFNSIKQNNIVYKQNIFHKILKKHFVKYNIKNIQENSKIK